MQKQENPSLLRKRHRILPKTLKTNPPLKSSQKTVPEAWPDLSAWGDGKGEDELPPEEIQMFEQENQRLIGEMNGLFDEVRQIEGKVVEISRLQEIFTEKALPQEAEVDNIHSWWLERLTTSRRATETEERPSRTTPASAVDPLLPRDALLLPALPPLVRQLAASGGGAGSLHGSLASVRLCMSLALGRDCHQGVPELLQGEGLSHTCGFPCEATPRPVPLAEQLGKNMTSTHRRGLCSSHWAGWARGGALTT